MRRTQVRQLAPGEEPPPGEPRRYVTGRYVRLRWKIGPASYVETYEHRLAAGVPQGDVHHGNGDKHDNDPGNLTPMTRSAHGRLHGAEATARSRRVSDWDGQRSQEAYDKRQRRLDREQRRREQVAEVRRLYETGLSTTEVGLRLKLSSGTVSRALRAAGGTARSPGGGSRDIPAEVRQGVHARDCMRCWRCGRVATWIGPHVHHRKRRSQGGAHTGANLILLCSDCHSWCHGNIRAARDQGWLLGRSAAPADHPAWSEPRGCWLLLGDDFSATEWLPPCAG